MSTHRPVSWVRDVEKPLSFLMAHLTGLAVRQNLQYSCNAGDTAWHLLESSPSLEWLLEAAGISNCTHHLALVP